MRIFGIKLQNVLIALLLVATISLGTALAFAFWDQTQETVDTHEITLGEAAFLRVEKTIDSDNILVPYGSFLGRDEVDEYFFSYRALFNKEGRLHVTIDETSIIIGDGFHDFNDLIKISINIEDDFDETLSNNLITPFLVENTIDDSYYIDVYFRLIVTSPSDPEDYLDAYLALKGQPVSFTIVFQALEIE